MGARITDFNMFYVFFGGIAAFATPMAATATVSLVERLKQTKRLRLAAGAIVLGALQLSWGAGIGVSKLQQSGPLGDFEPIPAPCWRRSSSSSRRQARLRFLPFGEATFAEPQLMSIDAHTSRRVVPNASKQMLSAT